MVGRVQSNTPFWTRTHLACVFATCASWILRIHANEPQRPDSILVRGIHQNVRLTQRPTHCAIQRQLQRLYRGATFCSMTGRAGSTSPGKTLRRCPVGFRSRCLTWCCKIYAMRSWWRLGCFIFDCPCPKKTWPESRHASP